VAGGRAGAHRDLRGLPARRRGRRQPPGRPPPRHDRAHHHRDGRPGARPCPGPRGAAHRHRRGFLREAVMYRCRAAPARGGPRRRWRAPRARDRLP
jgi:hypothetical protein